MLIIHQLYNLGDDFTLAPLQPSFVPSQTEKEPETFQPLGKQTNVEKKNSFLGENIFKLTNIIYRAVMYWTS
jgi:hypothetical protein